MVNSISNDSNPISIQALPPEAQEEREKNEILKHPRLQEILNDLGLQAASVNLIAFQPKGADKQYIVRTDRDFIIRVNLSYTHDETRLQPARFSLSFFDAEIPKQYATGLKLNLNTGL